MKQITQNELKELLNEKQNNATLMEERLRISATSRDDLDTAKKCLGEARAYQDMLCYLNSVEIAPDTLCPTCKDFATCYHRQRSGKNAIKCTDYNPPTKADGNIVEERIVTTIPKSKQKELGITQEDLKKFIPIRPTDKEKQKEFEEQVIMKPFIDEMKNIDPKEMPITPYNEPKTCDNCADYQKCVAQHIACDGRAWKPARNDRFREFEDGHTTQIIDAKEISSIEVNTINLNLQIYDNGNFSYEKFFKSSDEAIDYYNDLVAWWKYWKQN